MRTKAQLIARVCIEIKWKLRRKLRGRVENKGINLVGIASETDSSYPSIAMGPWVKLP